MWPRHKLQVVETDDFRKAMEAASGKDLKWFFDQWVYKAGHPELKVRWHYEDSDKTVRVQVQQTQNVDEQTPLFRLPTTLEITEAPGKPGVIPIVIDAAVARTGHPGGNQAPHGPDRPRRVADQGARFREELRGKLVSNRACVVRAGPPDRRQGTGQDRQRQARSGRPRWPRHGSGKKRSRPEKDIVTLMAGGDEVSAPP